jgi:hypothetical protein
MGVLEDQVALVTVDAEGMLRVPRPRADQGGDR